MKVDSAAIYDDIQRKLTTAQFAPGAKIMPATLQGEYGCSPNTVRDVLLRLSKVGLVEFEIQRGFRVREATPEVRSDITRFRILLEQEGAELSMARGGVQWEADLSAAHHALSHIEGQLSRSEGMDDAVFSVWSDAEANFHQTLISACGSPILTETYSNVYMQFRQQMVSLDREYCRVYFSTVITDHQSILDAALSRDIAACRAAIHDHLKRYL